MQGESPETASTVPARGLALPETSDRSSERRCAVNGERLRQVRKLRRLTQTRLAAMSGVTPSTISQVESGSIQPSPDLESALAASLEFPLEFFDRASGPDLPLGSLTFRARRSATKRDLYEAQAWAEIIRECIVQLAESFSLPAVRVPRLDDESPETAAQIARASLGLSSDRPVPNVTYAMEQAGTLVLALPVPLGHRDAFSTWTNDAPPRPSAVVCTRDTPGDRLRHSLAHELGHLVLHRGPSGAIASIEKEADRFAAEFLVPADSAYDEFSRPVTLESPRRPQAALGRVSGLARLSRSRTRGHLRDPQPFVVHRDQPTVGPIESRADRPSLGTEKPRALRKLVESAYGDPPNVWRFASDLALPPQLASAILGAHASRSEAVAVVPDEPPGDRIVHFPRPRPNVP